MLSEVAASGAFVAGELPTPKQSSLENLGTTLHCGGAPFGRASLPRSFSWDSNGYGCSSTRRSPWRFLVQSATLWPIGADMLMTHSLTSLEHREVSRRPATTFYCEVISEAIQPWRHGLGCFSLVGDLER